MRRASLVALLAVGSCVYFNAWYDATREYDEGLYRLSQRNAAGARVNFDTVIAVTGRILARHPDSKYADDAAILKTRAELHNQLWESAAETARRAGSLAHDSGTANLAIGLEGIAERELGELRRSDSLLTLALGGDLRPDDRAQILLTRGLTRQGLGRPGEAVQDLEAAGDQLDLTAEGRLNLAIVLRDVGEYTRSAEVSRQLVTVEPLDLRSPLYAHIDSLSKLAPAEVETHLAGLLEAPELGATRAAAYQYLRGRAFIDAGQPETALPVLDAAIEAAPTSSFAYDASYWAIRLRLQLAREPGDVSETQRYYRAAGLATDSEMRSEARNLGQATRTFEGLMEAYRSRGADAAEALLRAAEIARVDLAALAVSRGLYLLYLDLAPDSPWVAKAIYGALGASGNRPRDGWVDDRGEETDAALRARLSSLPADDPYRLVLTDERATVPDADSLYQRAENDLRRRLSEIQVLLDPGQAVAAPVDSAPAEPDTSDVRFRDIDQ